MKPETLSLIRNPYTGASLTLSGDALVDPQSGQTFPTRDGIAMFLHEPEVSGSNKKYQQMYNGFAPMYDLSQSIVYFMMGGETRVRRTLLEGLEARAGDRVLEVSVGTGANFRILPRTCKFHGLDISLGMLNRCKRNVQKWGLDAEFFYGNAEQLPFADNSFDVVYHVGGINFFNDRRRALQEMIRVAKPGTCIVISDESEKAAKTMTTTGLGAEFYKDRQQPIAAPADLLPEDMGT